MWFELLCDKIDLITSWAISVQLSYHMQYFMKPGGFSMAQYLFSTYLTNEKPSTQPFINIKHNNYSNVCQIC